MANDSEMLNRSKNSTSNDKNEYYTLYEDIAAELSNYKEFLKGKNIICPCDWDESLDEVCVFASEERVGAGLLFSPGGAIKTIDTGKSKHFEKDLNLVKCNFIKYLISHAEDWGIASISVSGYNPATREGVRFQDVDYSKYDICITNPPFSLFREFIETMFKHNISFLVIGPQNAITYKDVFAHIKNNEMWLGYHYHLAGFIRPDGTRVGKQDNLARSCCWFTNLPVNYRNKFIMLDQEFDQEKYQTYDNYDAINVDNTKDIPYDYDGIMGVPITFLQRYCPEQFEIISITGAGNPLCHKFYKDMHIHKDGKMARNMKSARYAPMIHHENRPEEKTFYTTSNVDGYLTKCFARIFIKRK